MPDSAGEIMKKLDDINEQLENIKSAWETAADEYVLTNGEYELIEGRIAKKLHDEKLIGPSSIADLSKREARVKAEDEHEKLWTRRNEALGHKESCERIYKILDIQRSNLQSNLKAMTRTET